MSEKTLTELLREHYAGRRLRPETVRRLLAMSRVTRARARLPKRAHVWLTVAAGGVAILLLLAGLVMPYVRSPGADLASAVAGEVAENHWKHGPPVREATTWSALAPLEDEVGFAPAPPARLPSDLTLAGGRACSILGSHAVQLTLIGPGGGTHTLYQAPALGRLARVDETFPMPPRLVGGRSSGERPLSVRVWREGAFVYALASAGAGD